MLWVNNYLDAFAAENGYPDATRADADHKDFATAYSGAMTVNHLFLDRVHESSGYFEFDSAQNFASLNGAPGVYTARFGAMNGYGESHDADANIQCLLDKLEDAETRKARFRTVIALVQGGKEMLFEGIVEGNILQQRVGNGGFGYDPIFAPVEANGLAFAQMSAEAKNAISHRGRATKKLAEYLCQYNK